MNRHAEREIRLEGVFDDAAGLRVRDAIENARTGDRLRIDLGDVLAFEEFGFAVLAQALVSAPDADVEVAGLLDHHVRVLQYLGVAPHVFASSFVGVVH